MMKFSYIASILVFLSLVLGSCSKEESSKTTDTKMENPEVIVKSVTTNGFTAQWEGVQHATSYSYSLNGDEMVSTNETSVTFTGLQKQQEYVFAIKACTKEEGYTESGLTYAHVITSDLEQLPMPKITIGSTYPSCTIVSWGGIPEAVSYEYSIDGKTETTSERTINLTTLAEKHNYTLTVKALSSDPLRFSDSDAAEVSFTTETNDVPPLIIATTDVISDAAAYSIYATSDMTYYYDVVPATSFVKLTETDIISTYKEAIVEYAQKQGVSFPLAMASLLRAGSQNMTITGLIPELSYEIIAFGMDLNGNVTTGLCHKRFTTTGNGWSYGPNFGGSDWFTQSFYISNAYAALGYNWTNSVWFTWKGTDVVSVRYRTLPTSSFVQVFPTTDKAAITAFLKDDNYAYEAPEAYIIGTNSSSGNMAVSQVSMGTSYTLSCLATSSSGEETLCVNSVTTKTSSDSKVWFQISAYKDEKYGTTDKNAIGAMTGVSIAACSFGMFNTSSLDGVSTSNYGKVVEEFGHTIPEERLENLNGGGYAIVFSNLTPLTSYTFIAKAVNTAGDEITKYATVTTDATSKAAMMSLQDAMPVTLSTSPEGVCVPDIEHYLFPITSTRLPEGAKPEGDLWTIIHNMNLLN